MAVFLASFSLAYPVTITKSFDQFNATSTYENLHNHEIHAVNTNMILGNYINGITSQTYYFFNCLFHPYSEYGNLIDFSDIKDTTPIITDFTLNLQLDMRDEFGRDPDHDLDIVFVSVIGIKDENYKVHRDPFIWDFSNAYITEPVSCSINDLEAVSYTHLRAHET